MKQKYPLTIIPPKVFWMLKNEFDNLLQEIIELYDEITEENIAKWFEDFCNEYEIEGFVITGNRKYKIIIDTKQLFEYIVENMEILYEIRNSNNQ